MIASYILENNKFYIVEKIILPINMETNIIFNIHCSNLLYVAQGALKVLINNEKKLITESGSFFINKCTHYKLINPGVIELVLIIITHGIYPEKISIN